MSLPWDQPLAEADPEIHALIIKEQNRQKHGLEMIASEVCPPPLLNSGPSFCAVPLLPVLRSRTRTPSLTHRNPQIAELYVLCGPRRARKLPHKQVL